MNISDAMRLRSLRIRIIEAIPTNIMARILPKASSKIGEMNLPSVD